MGRSNDGWVAARRRPIRRFAVLAGLLVFCLVATACASDSGAETTAPTAAVAATSTSSTVSPQEAQLVADARAVVITATSCGNAARAVGSGVAISPTRILTVAHVIAGSTEVSVTPFATFEAERSDAATGATDDRETNAERAVFPATILAFDPLRDLALLEIDPDAWTGAEAPSPFPSEAPVYEVLAARETGTIIGGVNSGDVAFTITEKTIIEMDEVRGPRRSRRSGYLIDAATDRGDSGAGLYAESGPLVGLLFAVSTGNNRRSWATAADELQDFLGDDSVTGSFACNPDESELERQP